MITLSNATYPYVLKLANLGLCTAIQTERSIARGVNTLGGHVTHKAVAEALGLEHVDVEEALAA